jgi:hypothetical protein
MPIYDAQTKLSAQLARDPCGECRVSIAGKNREPLFTLPPAARGAMVAVLHMPRQGAIALIVINLARG